MDCDQAFGGRWLDGFKTESKIKVILKFYKIYFLKFYGPKSNYQIDKKNSEKELMNTKIKKENKMQSDIEKCTL